MKNNLYVIHIKAIFSDKLTWIIMIFSFFALFLIINNFSINSVERSSIPIGVLNLDQGKSADELVDNMKEIPALFIFQGSETELKELLYKDEIRAYFIIKAGYEKSIQAGNTDELITMNYLEADESAKILSDIIAGEMLYKICLFKGYNLYHSLPKDTADKSNSITQTKPNNVLSEEEYMQYADSLMTKPDFNFAFDISMKNIKNQVFKDEINNSILYLQAIWGIVAMLLSFTAMLMTAGAVLEKESGILSRVKISLLQPYHMDLTHFVAAFTVQSIFASFLCICLIGKTGKLTTVHMALLFLSLELFSAVMILWFLILGKLSRSTGRYQFISIISVLFFGILGFLYLMSGFIDNKILNITKIIPNYWFIEEFTDIILNKNLQDIPYLSYIKFMITVCGLFVINEFISKRQYR
ncbi:MAG: ABC transporter permease [Anaerocolumna sp.]